MRALGLILLQLVMSLIVTASVMAAAIVAVPPLRDRPALGAGLMVAVCAAAFVCLVRWWPSRRG